MVVTAATKPVRQAHGDLRPMDPARDLGTIADLIANAFAEEITERDRAALREIRWMGRMSPLVWWWAQADPAFRDSFNGFVWEEPFPRGKEPFPRRKEPFPRGKGGQIVGNINLNRAPGSRQRWIICNVVVQAEYRGQGIGRKLTEAAIAEAQFLGAEGLVLQVYQDNSSALQLYTDLGFRVAGGEIDLRLDTVRSVMPQDASGYWIRARRPSDGEAMYNLARLVTPSAQQWLTPVRADRYRLGWWTRLGQSLSGLLHGRRVYRLTALKGDRLVAMMTLTAALRRGDHHLELLVHPDHAGAVDAALVNQALYILLAAPSWPVQARVSKAHTATLDVLRSYGFQEQRTLLTLRQDFV